MRTFVSILIIFAGLSAAAGQQRVPSQILTDALQQLGGEAKIRSFKSIYFSGKGFEDSSANAQPFKPGSPAKNLHEEKLAVFLDGRRLAYELKTDRGDGTTRWRRFYFTETQKIVADFGTKSVYALNIRFPSVERDQDARRIPHLFLMELLANAKNLKKEAPVTFEGKQHDVLSILLPNAKVPIKAFIDRATSLLSKYEFTAEFPGLGVTTIEYSFENYLRHPDLGSFPKEQKIKIGGNVFRSVTVDKAVADGSESEAMLQLPADLEGHIVPSGTVKEISKGVFFVYGVGGFQPMFIEFPDHVMAIEAPANVPVLEKTPLETWGDPAEASRQFIEKIKKTVPNKPIKYVVITHTHADHFGGLRAFIPEKPIVLTTPGNKEYFERFVPELKVETVDKKRTFSGKSRVVEIIDVGRNPHTEENLVVYLPQIKFMFQGDLFYFNSDSTFPQKDRMTVMPFFAKWLKSNGLAPERIYGFHSTMFGTMEHIDKILKLGPQNLN